MMKIYVASILGVVCYLKSVAQNDSIQRLEKVTVRHNKNKRKQGQGQKLVRLSTEQVVRNPTNFTETLRYNSPIAFRDYGNGGTSSARFRGTSATNTAVLWNGLSINAVGNGQTDFNALSASTTDEIIIISGGASTTFGSGAIGGVIQLNDDLHFKSHQNFQLFSSYGSFNTSSNFFKVNIGAHKLALKIATTINRSDNDYEYIDTRFKDENDNLLKNENANYRNYGINTSLGYKFSNTNKLFFYTTVYRSNRLFSAGLPNPSSGSERNQDFYQRNLLKWNTKFSNFTQSIKLGYLTQEYRYYSNKDAVNFDLGKSEKQVVDYSLIYRLSNQWDITYFMLYENTIGNTNTINRRRESLGLGGLLTFAPNEKTIGTLGFRKEYNSDFSVPVSVTLAGEKSIFNKFKFKSSLSTNYRVPTFNELFWPVVGNSELTPERSKQVDFGFNFTTKLLTLSGTYFFINIKDKIIWRPIGTSNLWRPKNLDDVINKGFEIALKFNLKVLKEHKFSINTNYVYTQTENTKTRKPLIFVPLNLVNYNIDYNYKRCNLFVQGLYQSKVYTTEDTIDFHSLDFVNVMNVGINILLYQKSNHNLVLGSKMNNIFNKVYYFTNLRPMPGRNLNVNINYKF